MQVMSNIETSMIGKRFWVSVCVCVSLGVGAVELPPFSNLLYSLNS